MRLLVVSDSHSNAYNLRNAVLRQPNADMIIHLGDGQSEYESVILGGDKESVFVRGNCDYNSKYPALRILEVGGKRVMCTHGYAYHVKYGLLTLSLAAKEQKADIVLFGHTHQPLELYEDGIYYLNPGSVSSGTYGYVDILSSGIMTNILKI